MIINFHQVTKTLYRGGNLSPADVSMLKKHYGVKRIVSLDQKVANRIDRACKLLGVEHIVIPLEIGRKSSILKLLKYNLCDLLGSGISTYVGCMYGRNRSGFVVAMFRCKCEGWSCKKAIDEADRLGINFGAPPKIISYYKQIIKKVCKCSEKDKQDINDSYDMVSNMREEPLSYSNYSEDPQQPWGKYEDATARDFPYSPQYIDYQDQYANRNDYNLEDPYPPTTKVQFPQNGILDVNNSGIGGAGACLVGSGFIE